MRKARHSRFVARNRRAEDGGRRIEGEHGAVRHGHSPGRGRMGARALRAHRKWPSVHAAAQTTSRGSPPRSRRSSMRRRPWQARRRQRASPLRSERVCLPRAGDYGDCRIFRRHSGDRFPMVRRRAPSIFRRTDIECRHPLRRRPLARRQRDPPMLHRLRPGRRGASESRPTPQQGGPRLTSPRIPIIERTVSTIAELRQLGSPPPARDVARLNGNRYSTRRCAVRAANLRQGRRVHVRQSYRPR